MDQPAAWARRGDLQADLGTLADLFMINPAGTREHSRTYLQERKIVRIGNQEAKTDQFQRSLP